MAHLKPVRVCINIYHHHYSKDPLRTVRPENFAGNRPGTESGTGTGTGESLQIMEQSINGTVFDIPKCLLEGQVWSSFGIKWQQQQLPD